MKLTAADLAVAIQTLYHSLSFRGDHGFMYTSESRTRVLERLTEVLNSIDVEVVSTPADPATLTADTGA